MKYSFKLGFWKGIKAATVALILLMTFAGFSDLTIWSLLVTYAKPVLETMSVGLVLKIVLNYAKVRSV